MTIYTCKFCDKNFTTKSNLNYHQKNTKYCLKIQGNLNSTILCQYCKKSLSSNRVLKTHITQCTSYLLYENSKKYEDKISFLEQQLSDKDLRIKELEKQMLDVTIKAVSKSTTTNKTLINNYIQQLQPLTDQHLTDNVQHLTIDHILKGPEGYAQYALEYPLKDRMICVDYSRRKVKFKDNDGNVITDPDMTNLATKFFNSIKDKNKELIVECSDKLKENFGDEVDTIVKIFDYKAGVDNGSDGTKTEFQDDFVKSMCGQTLKE